MRFRDDYEKFARQGINTVWVLIIINVALYIVNPSDKFALWANSFAPSILPEDCYSFAPYQLITYMFMHGGFAHILFNMWGMHIFGLLIAPILGRVRFLILYFVSGISGALLFLLANWNHVPVSAAVGASGALFGVMMAVAMLRPNVELCLFFVILVKMKTLVVVYALLEIISHWRGGDNIAHLAHLGGFIGAYFYIIFFCKKDVVWSLKDLFAFAVPHSSGKSFDRHAPGSDAGENGPTPHITHVSQQEVDRLLDKISNDGINSLTDYERAELQFFREQMKNNSSR